MCGLTATQTSDISIPYAPLQAASMGAAARRLWGWWCWSSAWSCSCMQARRPPQAPSQTRPHCGGCAAGTPCTGRAVGARSLPRMCPGGGETQRLLITSACCWPKSCDACYPGMVSSRALHYSGFDRNEPYACLARHLYPEHAVARSAKAWPAAQAGVAVCHTSGHAGRGGKAALAELCGHAHAGAAAACLPTSVPTKAGGPAGGHAGTSCMTAAVEALFGFTVAAWVLRECCIQEIV